MQRIGYIDGLKGISAITVVLAHIQCSFSTVSNLPFGEFPASLLSDFYNGRMAVAIFVLASAFIMGQLCQDETRYQSILLKRYFRLMIPCIVPILLMALCFYTSLGYNDELGEHINNDWLRWWPAGLSWKKLPQAILGAPVGEAWEWVNVMWMLKYVFLTPFVVVILEIALRGIRPVAKVVILLLCLVVSYKHDIWLTTIFMGYIFSQINDMETQHSIRHRTVMCVLITIGMVALYLVASTKAFNDRNNIVKAICFVSVIMMWEPMRRLFSTKLLLWLGNISFEIYLLHLLVIYILSCRMYGWLNGVPHRLWIISVVTIAVTILLAWVYKWTVSKLNDRCTNLIMDWINKYKKIPQE